MLTLHSPLDMHLHLRDETMLSLVAPLSSHSFAGALIMPNLVPPITTLNDVIAYKDRIMAAVKGDTFEPYMTLFFQKYDPKILEDVRNHIIGIKLYPAGITTNSENGVKNLNDIHETLLAMESLGIPLCVHGESNGFVMDREEEFLSVYEKLATTYPQLKIIMEHITTKSAVELLDRYENLFATVTLHHLMITLDDVAGGMLKPHLFCKPIAKRPADRDALAAAALSAHPKLMFGSDSAPHPIHKKEACGCAAGVFTAPIALPMLAQFFETHHALERLQAFVSDNACKIYTLTPPKKSVTLVKEPSLIPDIYADAHHRVVPMNAGESMTWSFSTIQ